MNQDQIFEEVVRIIQDYVKDPALLETITLGTRIIEDLKVNSARLVDIIINTEDAFDIEIADDEADRIKTIGDAVGVISQKKKAA